MQSVVIPHTSGLETSRVGFGLASLHHLFGRRSRWALLQHARDLGIRHFDSSPFYGNGLADRDLSCFSAAQRSSITVATKVGLYPRCYATTGLGVYAIKMLGKGLRGVSRPVVNWTVRRAEASLARSLANSRVGYFDILFLHEPLNAYGHAEELHRWIEDKKRAGMIRYWGVAGEQVAIESWMNNSLIEPEVIQTRDDGFGKAAALLKRYGRLPQFTYGYFGKREKGWTTSEVVHRACQANPDGTILISSRFRERVREVAVLCELQRT